MKIDKAIEILTPLFKGQQQQRRREAREAIELGIEALKRTQSNRKAYWGAAYVKLPGETTD